MNENFSAEERVLLRGKQVRENELKSLQAWYPVLLGNDALWWRYFGKKKFSEPFFHDTVSILNRQHSPCLQTAFDAARKLDDVIAPSAFIFHVSRCGSTLLTQLLASMPECIVMSESSVIDSFLRRYHAGEIQGDAGKLLRDIVSALGQRRFAEESHFFIKLDSWHIASLPLFRRVFPDTPFLFLYREPKQVLASHQRQRGRQMVPGMVNAAMPALDFSSLPPSDLDAYCIKMLAYFFSNAHRYANELIIINYQQLPHIVWDTLLEYFSISPSPAQLKEMKLRSTIHSKNKTIFSGDPQDIKSVDTRTCAIINPHYAILEQLRAF